MFERFLNSGTYTYFHVHACVPCCFSCVRFFSTPWAIAWQTRLSMGFTREEYWSGLPCPHPRDLSDPVIKVLKSPVSPALWVDSLPTEPPGKPTYHHTNHLFHPKRKENRCPCKGTCMNIHSGLIHMTWNGKQFKGHQYIMRKTKGGHPCNRIVLSNKMEWSTDAFNNTVGTQNYYTEWMKQNTIMILYACI